jgi:hypothetical protein
MRMLTRSIFFCVAALALAFGLVTFRLENRTLYGHLRAGTSVGEATRTLYRQIRGWGPEAGDTSQAVRPASSKTSSSKERGVRKLQEAQEIMRRYRRERDQTLHALDGETTEADRKKLSRVVESSS